MRATLALPSMFDCPARMNTLTGFGLSAAHAVLATSTTPASRALFMTAFTPTCVGPRVLRPLPFRGGAGEGRHVAPHIIPGPVAESTTEFPAAISHPGGRKIGTGGKYSS